MPDTQQWELAKERILATQQLVESMISAVDKADWFRMPSEGVTHVAWQVGHLALANYGLGVMRPKGLKADDVTAVPASYFKLFGKGSTPSPDASIYPNAEEIHSVYQQIDQEVAKEIAAYDPATLDEKLEPAHPMFDTKFKALLFLPNHMMLHCGQIALLRRLFGNAPLR